ncbi:phospholipid-transporting ATPase ABCA3 isoform X1 [Drosophila bipectinata]|uniref:phospholipid-transporting ATPase ABCA3 isoform X1 n=1 Tax=Drosophila bipectinata TaxID=42026 RepID=UPI0038B293AE
MDKGPSVLTKCYLVTWKNFGLFFNVRSIILACVFLLLPVAIMSLRFLDSEGDIVIDSRLELNSADLEDLSNDTNKIEGLGYTPKSDFLEAFLKAANLNVTKAFSNRRDLVANVKEEKIKYGIQFPDSWSDMSSLPDKFSFSIVSLDPYQALIRFGMPEKSTYAEKPAFLKIQNVLSLQYIYAKAEERKISANFTVPEFKVLPSLPTHNLGSIPGLGMLQYFMSIVLLTSRLATVILEEKVLQLKETLRMLSVSNFIQWLAWYIFGMSVFTLLAVVNTICWVLKLPAWSQPMVPYCNWSIILVMLIIFGHAAVCFAFLVSSIFNSRKRIYIWTLLGLVVSFLPRLLIDTDSGPVQIFISSMFLMTGIRLSLDDVESWGYFNDPMEWSSFFDVFWAGGGIGFGWKLVAILLGSVICIFLCLYIDQIHPGPYGVSKPWHFPCSICCKKHGLLKSFYRPYIHCLATFRRHSDEEHADPGDNITLLTEPLPGDKKVGVEIKNICRSFGTKNAVKNLSFSILEDEVTILMGHNGAGKTTLISMLTCFIQPTSGTALINGYDIRTQRSQARRCMGVCPQSNVLFSELSVASHIRLFARLRGMKGPAVKEEVKKYLEKLNLKDKSHVAAKKLSGGTQRRLNVACALCGGVKVLFCDEPSTGLDPASRRELWKLILEAKKGCSILLTTHQLDDGEALGDRFAIVSDGQLRCHGTLSFLKRQVDASSLLTCEAKKNCDVQKLTSLIASHVGAIQPDSFIGRDICYKLPLRLSSSFPSLFRDLEQKKDSLGIRGFGVSAMSLEEIFMTYGAEKPKILSLKSRPIRESGGREEDQVDIEEEDETDRNCADHWRAMMSKKMLFMWHEKILFLVILLIPTLYCVSVLLGKLVDITVQHSMDISNYGDASLQILVQEPKDNEDGVRRMEILKKLIGDYCDVKTISEPPEDYVEDKFVDNKGRHEVKFFLMAVDFENGITGWTGPKEILHAVPLTINVIYNVLAKDVLGPEASIVAANSPQQSSFFDKFDESTRIYMALIYIVIVLYVLSMSIIHERTSHMKQQQAVSGVSMITYWMSHFVVDLLVFMICMLPLAPCVISDIDWGRTLFVFFLIGASSLLLLYLLASVASAMVTNFVFAFAIVGNMAILIIAAIAIWKKKFMVLVFLLYLHPLHCGLTALSKCDKMNRICGKTNYEELHKESLCLNPMFSLESYQCLCNGFLTWFEEKFLIFLVVLYFILLMLFEYGTGLCYALKDICQGKADDIEDPEIARKAEKIANYSDSQLRSLALVVRGVSKSYMCQSVVNNVSFAVRPQACVGLLGPNGAGKTTTFKMIVGDTLLGSGNVFIKGYSVKTQKKLAISQMGYCPQFDSFFEFFTGRQALYFFLRLRGTQRTYLKGCAEKLAQDFGFRQHLDAKIKNYSGGTKRKINAAVASRGETLICMDEPSSGVDPASRRHIWNIYQGLASQNKSVLLTSHSMDEINALCSKIVILVDGKISAMGSNQNVKDKITQYLVIKMTVKATQEDMEKILSKIEEELPAAYPGASLEEKYEFSGRLVFRIPNKDIKLSEVYGLLEKNRNSWQLLDYFASQPTFDDVFEDILAEKKKKEDQKKHKEPKEKTKNRNRKESPSRKKDQDGPSTSRKSRKK